MTTDNSRPNDNILFTNLIMMLSTSTMQNLGKLVNPMTNKPELNLEIAQLTIDMLEMLRNKTKGNLDKDEEKFLGGVLSSLQMNYVETEKSAPAKAVEAEKQKPADKPKEADTKDDQAKYHKSYGE